MLSPAIVVICRAITARFLFPVASCWSVSPIFLFVSIVPWRAVLFLPENSGTRQNETERNKHNDNLKKPRKSHEDVIIFVLHFWKSFVSAEAIDVYILSKVPPGVVGTSRFIFSFFFHQILRFSDCDKDSEMIRSNAFLIQRRSFNFCFKFVSVWTSWQLETEKSVEKCWNTGNSSSGLEFDWKFVIDRGRGWRGNGQNGQPGAWIHRIRQSAGSNPPEDDQEGLWIHADGGRRVGTWQVHSGQHALPHGTVQRAGRTSSPRFV